MILERLAALVPRLRSEGRVEPPGMAPQKIQWIVAIGADGAFRSVIDARIAVRFGRKEVMRPRDVAYAADPETARRTSGDAPNLLWDNAEYLFGRAKADDARSAERAARRRGLALAKLDTFLADHPGDAEAEAVRRFLGDAPDAGLQAHPLWAELIESGAFIGFQVEGSNALVGERRADIAAWLAARAEEADVGQCLVTGDIGPIQRLHGSIKGVRDGQSSGGSIVSFNLDAFASHGLEQGANAPVGAAAAQSYVSALNVLLASGSKQVLLAGDTTYVIWASQAHPVEQVAPRLLQFGEDDDAGPTGSDIDAAAATYARRLIDAAKGRHGLAGDERPEVAAYVLGLAPNVARIAVRFWSETTAGALAANVVRHYRDLAIAAPFGRRLPGHRAMLASLAVGGKEEALPPGLAGDIMRAALAGGPYPRLLLALAVARARAEAGRRDGDAPLRAWHRAAFLKAFLNRHAPEQELAMALDPDNVNVGYRLGRLFATLERIQEAASPGINATIRDRFYGAASATPKLAFPSLLKLERTHLGKLDPGRRVTLEKLVGEIIDGLPAGAPFPAVLRLEDQGRFAVGYYHQRQHFFRRAEAPDAAASPETLPA